MSKIVRTRAIGEVAQRTDEVFRRLAIIDAAQRVGLTLNEIRDVRGSRDQPAHKRLRQRALPKLPEVDDLIARATSVRRVLKICCNCKCESIDVCRMFDDRVLPLHEHSPSAATRRSRRRGAGRRLTSTGVEVQHSPAALAIPRS